MNTAMKLAEHERSLLRGTLGAISLVLLLHSPSDAQVVARQATPEDRLATDEIPSPMILEVSLGVRELNGKTYPAMNEMKPNVPRNFSDTAKYSCQKARVTQLRAVRFEEKGKTGFELGARLATEHFRQDVDLTIALMDGGKEIASKTWNDLTIGAEKGHTAARIFAPMWVQSSSKMPTTRFNLSPEQIESLFADGEPPRVRVIVAIEEDEEDEDD